MKLEFGLTIKKWSVFLDRNKSGRDWGGVGNRGKNWGEGMEEEDGGARLKPGCKINR